MENKNDVCTGIWSEYSAFVASLHERRHHTWILQQDDVTPHERLVQVETRHVVEAIELLLTWLAVKSWSWSIMGGNNYVTFTGFSHNALWQVLERRKP
jgi:hypothetical protein